MEVQIDDAVYGIRAEKAWCGGKCQIQYAAYRYEPNPDAETPDGRQYIYSMQLKRWLTLEIALMHYAVEGITCFPIFSQRPDCISEGEIARLASAGFDKILGRGDADFGAN